MPANIVALGLDTDTGNKVVLSATDFADLTTTAANVGTVVDITTTGVLPEVGFVMETTPAMTTPVSCEIASAASAGASDGRLLMVFNGTGTNTGQGIFFGAIDVPPANILALSGQSTFVPGETYFLGTALGTIVGQTQLAIAKPTIPVGETLVRVGYALTTNRFFVDPQFFFESV